MNSEKLNSAVKVLSGLPTGPVVLILNEDDVELSSTITHHQNIGFSNIVVLGPSRDLESAIIGLDWTVQPSLADTINPLLPSLAGRWVLAVWNAEFFYFPFCEERAASDLLMFSASENRSAIHAMTVDIYCEDLEQSPNGVDLAHSYFDGSGYFSQDRFDGPHRLERQKNIFGGLKWRYMQHIPWQRQRIDRVPLFKVSDSSVLSEDGLLEDPEQNTLESAWHKSLTGAVVSCRVAKSLRHNPGSQFDVGSFKWSQSQKFEWASTQLMAQGFMEPGQWF